MKNGQQGFSNALGNIATQSIEAVGQPARLTQADHRNGADAQESSEVGNGSPLPAATIRRNESRIKTVVAVDPGASGGL